MEYFIYQNDKPHGPLSYEELKNLQIIATTPVWKDGLAGWVHASALDELKGIFFKQPPVYNPTLAKLPLPEQSVSTTEAIGFKLGKSIRTIIIVAVIAVIALFFYNSLNRNHSSSYSQPMVVEDPEHSTPSEFLNASGTYHTNFWGDKYVLNGKITNNATHTNYKDVHVKISFLSTTKTVIGSESYVIYEYVPYGSTKDFTLRLQKPPVANSCAIDAVSATYY